MSLFYKLFGLSFIKHWVNNIFFLFLLIETKKMEYKELIKEYPKIDCFLREKNILSIDRLYSIWRKENLLLKINCEDGRYVFKQINNLESDSEAEKVKRLGSIYPNIIPKVFVQENNTYLMEFVDGKCFFDLSSYEKIEKMVICGGILGQNYKNGYHESEDIRHLIRKSFERYRKKSARFFSDDELRDFDFNIFKEVASRPSHNDLNAANLLFDNGIKLIDPNEEDFNDTAKDVGRYCASVFFNNYDYFGNKKTASLDIAAAFLTNFDDSTLERARYFIGESFLSFINFDTKTTPKEVLKKLAINMLTKKQKIIKNLEECI